MNHWLFHKFVFWFSLCSKSRLVGRYILGMGQAFSKLDIKNKFWHIINLWINLNVKFWRIIFLVILRGRDDIFPEQSGILWFKPRKIKCECIIWERFIQTSIFTLFLVYINCYIILVHAPPGGRELEFVFMFIKCVGLFLH